MLRRLLNDVRGATAIEYSVIAAVISVAAIGAFVVLGQGVNGKFQEVDSAYETSQ